MTKRRFIERGELGEWSLLVKGEDVLAVRQVLHDGQVYLSTEDRPNHPDKQSQYQLDVEGVIEQYAARSGTETPEMELLADVHNALSAADPGGETP